jgi:hypothetical protein
MITTGHLSCAVLLLRLKLSRQCITRILDYRFQDSNCWSTSSFGRNCQEARPKDKVFTTSSNPEQTLQVPLIHISPTRKESLFSGLQTSRFSKQSMIEDELGASNQLQGELDASVAQDVPLQDQYSRTSMQIPHGSCRYPILSAKITRTDAKNSKS